MGPFPAEQRESFACYASSGDCCSISRFVHTENGVVSCGMLFSTDVNQPRGFLPLFGMQLVSTWKQRCRWSLIISVPPVPGVLPPVLGVRPLSW